MSDIVILRTQAGHFHRGAIAGDRILTDEGCNLDDAHGHYEVVDQATLSDADHRMLCSHCFGLHDHVWDAPPPREAA